jgi:hypothetical protein
MNVIGLTLTFNDAARSGRSGASKIKEGGCMPNRPLLSLCACSALILAGPPGRAAEADALAVTANVQARHLPFGTILDPIFTLTNSDQIAGYTRCGDSALWTGHYLAAEAFRYKVTQAPDALNNVKRAIVTPPCTLRFTVRGSGIAARSMMCW